MADEQANSTNPETPPTGEVSLQKIYVKDFSFEAPNSPAVFTEDWKPTVDIHLQNESTPLRDDLYDILLTVTVTVHFEEKTVYLVEVQQAGIFKVAGFPEQHMAAMLATVGPNILFPFAREAIADAVSKGGFPQLLLAPVNFEHLYAMEIARKQAESGVQTH